MSDTDILLTPRDRERGQQLQRKLVEFGRLLWDMGLDVGPGRLIEASQTLSLIDVRNREDFYHALKCSLLSHHEQEPLFDQAFFYFWQLKHRLNKAGQNAAVQSQDKAANKPLRLPPRERQELEAQAARLTRQLLQSQREVGRVRPLEREEQGQDDDDDEAQGTAYSAIEMLRRKDFETYTWEEMQEAKRLMAEMHWHLGERPTRRKAAARKGDYKLAKGDIVGGNAYLPVLFLLDTLISGKAVLPEAQASDIYLTALGEPLSVVYLVGLVFRPGRQRLRRSPRRTSRPGRWSR